VKSLAFLCAIILTVHGCGAHESWPGPLAFFIVLYLLCEK
jgi:hypothetical protein